MSTRAPLARTVDALTGARTPEKFFESLSEADNFCAELDGLRETQTRLAELEAENAATREAFAAAVGDYSCPCGSEFWFENDSGLEEYAALNRWLGRHVPCGAGVEAERAASGAGS